MRAHREHHPDDSQPASASTAPGKATLTGRIQRKAAPSPPAPNQEAPAAPNTGDAADDPFGVHLVAREVTPAEQAERGFAGEAMALPFRADMEQGFGTSFADVTAFGGPEAQAASAALGARAYTVGQQIAFDSPNPDKAVVAHELAHTIQQSGGASSSEAVQTWTDGGGDAFEAEADAAAAAVLAGEPATVGLRGPTGIQRWGGSDHYHIGNLAGNKALKKVKSSIGTKKVDTATPQAGAEKSTSTGGIKQPEKLDTVVVPTGGKDWLLGGGDTSISFGAASRYGGDYVKTADGLKGQLDETDLHMAVDQMEMLGGAATNANHFYPLNQEEYRKHHQLALAAAAKGDKVAALTQEGFASHFLADCFASGHTVPRSLDSVETMHNLDDSVIAAASGAMISKAPVLENGIKGLKRSKTWHDFFCALPDGLPMSDGHRYHGDYYMNGADLSRVSEVCAESLAEVLGALEGQPYAGKVTIVSPDFAAIQADPVAGPAWRMMMSDYQADLQKAQQQIKAGSKGVTDGGTEFNAHDMLKKLEQNTFGVGAAKPAQATGLKVTRRNCLAAFKAIRHYSEGQFKYNASLGPDGQNDDLEAPTEKDKKSKHWSSKDLRDRGLLQAAIDAAKAYRQAAEADPAASETQLAQRCVDGAQTLLDNGADTAGLAKYALAYAQLCEQHIPALKQADEKESLGETDLKSSPAGTGVG